MTSLVHQVCLLLGSNIEPERNIPLAIDFLRRDVTVLRSSSVWQTPSIGSPGPDFLNLALLVSTPHSASDLKEKILRPLEARLGRVRTADKFAPRPIDLDIVLFDDQILDPDLFRYAHKAVPVAELYPDLLSDKGKSLKIIAAELARAAPIRPKPDVIIES